MKLKFHIPRPPSVNALYANAPGKGRIKTARYKAWIADAGYAMQPQIRRWKELTCDVRVVMTVNKARCDLPNLEKAPFDLMKIMGVYKDDKQVVGFTMNHNPECGDLMFIEVAETPAVTQLAGLLDGTA